MKPYLSFSVVLARLCSIVQTGLAGPAEPDLKITLSIHNYARIESETLIRAEQEVTRIYRDIGVTMVWLEQQPQKKPDIVLTILAHPMAEVAAYGNSLGLAPGAGSKRELAYVFYDREIGRASCRERV